MKTKDKIAEIMRVEECGRSTAYRRLKAQASAAKERPAEPTRYGEDAKLVRVILLAATTLLAMRNYDRKRDQNSSNSAG